MSLKSKIQFYLEKKLLTLSEARLFALEIGRKQEQAWKDYLLKDSELTFKEGERMKAEINIWCKILGHKWGNRIVTRIVGDYCLRCGIDKN